MLLTKETLPEGKTEAKYLERCRRYREANREKTRLAVRASALKRRLERPAEVRAKDRELQNKVRLQAIMLLGCVCTRCGNNDSRVLQIDHVNGGGTQENKRVHSAGVARRVLKEPHDFQLLCANCNWIKRHERNENKQRIDDVSEESSSAGGDEVTATNLRKVG